MVGENSILRKVWTKASGVKVNSRVNRPSCLSVKGKGLSEESGSMKKKMFFEYKEYCCIEESGRDGFGRSQMPGFIWTFIVGKKVEKCKLF